MNMNDNIRYCRYCGKQIDADSTFCTHCGKSVDSRELSESLNLSFWTRLGEIVLLPLRFLKNCLVRIFSYKLSSESVRKFKKIFLKVLKAIVILVLIGCTIWGAVAGYTYYTEEYIPEKRLNEAVADIVQKYHNSNDSVKYLLAKDIITIGKDWEYDKVDNDEISEKLSYLRKEAFAFIEKKAYSGDPRYQYELGQIYRWGDTKYFFVEEDFAKAAYWWNEAANQGYVRAYNNLGISYKLGKGVNVDLRLAVEYLRKGAEAGEEWAQRNYGDLFLEGIQVKCGSHKEVRKTFGYHYNGEKIRQYYDYEKGETVTVYKVDVDDYETLVPKDIETAKSWWKKAAAQGNEVAKERLQKVYN